MGKIKESSVAAHIRLSANQAQRPQRNAIGGNRPLHSTVLNDKELEGVKTVPVVEKLRKSFEAAKESFGISITLGGCLAVSAICALVGIMVWTAEFIGPVLTCFLFSGFFMLAAGVVKFVIDAKEKEAARKFNSAKREIKQGLTVITTPLKAANRSASDHPIPFASLGILACLAVIAYYLQGEGAPSARAAR